MSSLLKTREDRVWSVKLPPRLPLFPLPTPLHRLSRLSDRWGVELWIKRDDLTGFALGGNKVRKLEFLLADAQAQGATHLLCSGASQSNLIRQAAVAGRVAGMSVTAVCMDQPFQGEGRSEVLPGAETGGNLALDSWSGLRRLRLPNATWDDLDAAVEEEAARLTAAGENVYVLPLGGSSPLGAYAFYLAGEEVSLQAHQPFDAIVTASSSGSTQVGLTTWFADSGTRVIGISADPEPEILDDLVDLSARFHAELGVGRALTERDFDFRLDYVGPGYAIPSSAGGAALRDLVETEGIFLDPTYTAKAFAGLTDLVSRGELRGRILFWHTGGIPALFGAHGPVVEG